MLMTFIVSNFLNFIIKTRYFFIIKEIIILSLKKIIYHCTNQFTIIKQVLCFYYDTNLDKSHVKMHILFDEFTSSKYFKCNLNICIKVL